MTKLMTDEERLIRDAAMMAVEEIEQDRAERRRTAAREGGKLAEAARDVLGDELVPRAGGRLAEARDASPRITAPPDWAEMCGLSEAEAREVASAPAKWSGDLIKVPR